MKRWCVPSSLFERLCCRLTLPAHTRTHTHTHTRFSRSCVDVCCVNLRSHHGVLCALTNIHLPLSTHFVCTARRPSSRLFKKDSRRFNKEITVVTSGNFFCGSKMLKLTLTATRFPSAWMTQTCCSCVLPLPAALPHPSVFSSASPLCLEHLHGRVA
jgi:hypothetical protein